MEVNINQYINKLKTELQKHVNFKSDEDDKMFYTEDNLIKDLKEFCPETIIKRALESYVNSTITNTGKSLKENKKIYDEDIKFNRSKEKFELGEVIDNEVVAYYKAHDTNKWVNYSRGGNMWDSGEIKKRREASFIRKTFSNIVYKNKQELKEYNNYCLIRGIHMTLVQIKDYLMYMGIAPLKEEAIVTYALRREYVTMSAEEICNFCKEHEKTLDEKEIKEFRYTVGREIGWETCSEIFIKELGLDYIFASGHKMEELTHIFNRLTDLHIPHPFKWEGIPKNANCYGYNSSDYRALTENNLKDYFEIFKCSEHMLILLKKSGDVINLLNKLIYDCNTIKMKEWLLENKEYLLRNITRFTNPEEQKTRQDKLWRRIESMEVVTKEDIENYERVKRLVQ
jgi:hypothetical protein